MPGTPETLMVYDATCPVDGDQTTVHRVPFPSGKRENVTFKHGEPTELPYPVALFLINRDPAWTAFTDDGIEIKAKAKTQHDPSLPVEIAANQCIADFDELTQEALIDRAVVLPGGTSFSKATKKTDLITFLTNHGHERLRQRNIRDGLIQETGRSAPPVDSDEVENLDELDAMLAGAAD